MIDFDKALTVQEVAELLKVSHQTVRRMCAKNPKCGGLPSYKMGGRVRIKESDLQAWIDGQKRWV